MGLSTYLWLKAAHLIGLFVWLGGLFAVYWLLRFHAHAPKEAHEKLTLMERSLALMMDIGSALAIGTGLAIALGMEPNYFGRPGMGWFHIKLTVVVLGVLPVHGLVRARIKKHANGNLAPIPQWLWSLLLVAIVVIAILVFRGPLMFAKS